MIDTLNTTTTRLHYRNIAGYAGVKTFITCFIAMVMGMTICSCDNPETPVPSSTITAGAGIGGTISPSGDVTVNNGENRTFTIIPDSGYIIDDVLIDGVSQGPVSSCTFTQVNDDHTISVTFKLASTTIPLTSLTGSYSDTIALYRIDAEVIITTPVVFGRNTRYAIYDTVFIRQNGSLTLSEGVSIVYGKQGALVAGDLSKGTLTINGTATMPVTMSAVTVGDGWTGIILDSNATGSVLDGLHLRDAVFGVLIDNAVVDIVNSRITHCRKIGVVYYNNARPSSLDGSGFAHNVIASCDSFGVYVNQNAAGYLATNNGLADTIAIGDGVISENQTWRFQPLPYVITKTVDIDSVSLTIAAGARFLFIFNAGFEVGDRVPATFRVEGTAAAPVIMSPLVDTMGWTGQGNSLDVGSIVVFPGCTDCSFRYLYMDRGTMNGIWVRDAIVDITDCRIIDFGGVGVYYSHGARPSALDGSGFARNVIDGCGKHPSDNYTHNAGLAVNPNAVGYLAVNDSLLDSVYIVDGLQPRGTQTWRKQPLSYVVVVQPIYIDSADITMAAGTEFLFDKKVGYTGIIVGSQAPGSLVIEGTADMPVIMRPHNPASTWHAEGTEGSLLFYPQAKPCTVRYLQLKNSARNGIYVLRCQLTVDYCTIDNCYDAGIMLISDNTPPYASLTIDNSSISNCTYGIAVVKNTSVLDTANVTFANNGENIHNEP